MSAARRIRLCNNFMLTDNRIGTCKKDNCNFAHRISELEEEECSELSAVNDVYLLASASQYQDRIEVFTEYYKDAVANRYKLPVFADLVVSRAFIAGVEILDVIMMRIHDLMDFFFRESRDVYLTRVLIIVNILRERQEDICEQFVSSSWGCPEMDRYVNCVKMPPAGLVAAESAARSYQVVYKYHLTVLKYIMGY